ncbi:sugar transferase [Thermosulfurimonas sp. F29]|uniref:sugar transferase n=1 Tax=Thermosulfurimonas sp. F29 TaxID=2867247 RepID=UPI001C82E3AE|nr:sugar transferase [Thermosulfurimonas sp. F29]MBX6421988.1 sugar transferase [Thermosulfurimonas sp. F29]
MFQQQARVINNFLMFLDAVCILLAGYVAYLLRRYLSGGKWTIDGELFVYSVSLVIFINNYTMGRIGLYGDRKFQNYLQLIWAVFKAVFVDFLFLSSFIFIFKKTNYSRGFFLLFASLSFFFMILERITVQIYLRHFARRRLHARNLLLVGDRQRGRIVAEALEQQLSWGHKIIGRVLLNGRDTSPDVVGSLKDLPQILRRYPVDEVIFAIGGDKGIDLPYYLDICRKMGVDARILPALWSPESPHLGVESIQGIPFLTLRVTGLNATGLLYKRILDIIGGLVGTFIFLLMYPFVAIAIKLDSPGPVLFKQKRVGQNGRIFTLYKFRTMYVDAEKRKRELMARNVMKGPMFKLEDDPRITRVGRFLRRTSLDEFPQFWNVLKGEMSLVGTRPPLPEEVEKYDLWHWRRISIKPGITGLWQISGRNKITDFEKVVELDCRYLENWCFLDDLKILLKTIVVVLQRKGAL